MNTATQPTASAARAHNAAETEDARRARIANDQPSRWPRTAEQIALDLPSRRAAADARAIARLRGELSDTLSALDLHHLAAEAAGAQGPALDALLPLVRMTIRARADELAAVTSRENPLHRTALRLVGELFGVL